MPHTVNGIGTNYSGKTNVEIESGQCEFCHRNVQLETYETGLYFVVLFIPLIPLGKKQILDMCPACSQHRVVELAEWQGIRKQALEDSAQMLQMRSNDPKAAVDHLQTLTTFRQKDEARELAIAMESTHADDVDVQLYLGSWMEQHESKGAAAKCYNRAYDLDPHHPGSKRARGLQLMELGSLDEARGMFSEMENTPEQFDSGVLLSLAHAYHNGNQHQPALELYRKVAVHNPAIQSDKEFRKCALKSEKQLGSNDSIVRRVPFYEYPAFWVAAACLMVAIGIMALAHHRAGKRPVHIVNGLPVTITVAIDDRSSYEIPSGSWLKTTLPEGGHSVKVVSPEGFQPSPFTIKSSFMQQIFQTPTWVLDPTQTAIVYKEETVYRENPVDGEGGVEFSTGNLLTVYHGINFPFRRFPDELQVDENRNSLRQSRVDFEPVDPTMFISGQLDVEPDVQLSIVEKFILGSPEQTDLWDDYMALGMIHEQFGRCAEFARPQLSVSPLNMNVHRAYQSISEHVSGTRQDDLARYDGYLADEPDNADLIYLRGRLAMGVEESSGYMKQALAIDPDHPRALALQGQNRMSRADYAGAITHFQRAVELMPEDDRVRDSYHECLIAVRDYDTLATEMKTAPDSFSRLVNQMTYLVKAKKFDSLTVLRERFVEESGEMGGWIFDLQDHYLKRQYDKMLEDAEHLAATPRYQALFRYMACIESADLDGAGKHFDELELHYADFELILAIAMHHAGRIEESEAIRERFIEENLAKGPAESQIATLLRDCESRVIGLEEIKDLAVEPHSKRIYAIAIREFSPESAEGLDNEIRSLNFQFSFPYHFIKSCLSDKTAKVGAAEHDANTEPETVETTGP